MSINNATPRDWDNLRKQVPAWKSMIDESLMSVYLEAAEKEEKQMEADAKKWIKRLHDEDFFVDDDIAEGPLERQHWCFETEQPLPYKEDAVANPSHYNTGNIECIEAIGESMSAEAFAGYLKGNCMKYLWRYDYKGKPVEDLQKAQWYLAELIKELMLEEEDD